jgi:arsenate reductase
VSEQGTACPRCHGDRRGHVSQGPPTIEPGAVAGIPQGTISLLCQRARNELREIETVATQHAQRYALVPLMKNEPVGVQRLLDLAGGSPRENQKPNPLALETLSKVGVSIERLYSKSMDEFGAPDAPKMDLLITVCDNAADSVCPIWPGHPISAHWGIPDPAEVKGDDEAAKKAFADPFMVLSRRIALMVNLPFEKLDRLALQKELVDISCQNARSVNSKARDKSSDRTRTIFI